MPKPGNIPDSFVDALESLANWLQNSHIPYSIIGGVAVSFIANPRTTQDIDSVIWLDIAKLDDFLASGSDYGFVSRLSDAAEFARQSRVLLLRHFPSSVDIDISLAATPFEQELLDRALTISLGNFSVNIPPGGFDYHRSHSCPEHRLYRYLQYN
ncbi:MAG: hypothetical protein IPL01_24220 [Acidobacteria bacterium]|nr:hypothetical protein [Acidobacteriota bacterium]